MVFHQITHPKLPKSVRLVPCLKDGQLYHTARPSADGADGPWPFREKFFLNMNLAAWAPGGLVSKAVAIDFWGE
jgi:hypothetical protein